MNLLLFKLHHEYVKVIYVKAKSLRQVKYSQLPRLPLDSNHNDKILFMGAISLGAGSFLKYIYTASLS